MNKNLNIPQNKRLRNEKLILRFLTNHGSTTRRKICKTIGLPISTGRNTIKQLCRKGLIRETKGKSKTRGPKPIIVSLNPQGEFIASAMISPSSITIGLLDIHFEPIEIVEIPVKTTTSPQKVARLLQSSLSELMDKHHISQYNLYCLGIALPGTILSNDFVQCSSPLRWKNVPFKKILSKYFYCSIIICKINARGLLGDSGIFPALWDENIVLYLSIGQGVGASLAMEGKIIQGSSNLCGEIGHIVVDPSGPVCGCGSRGCLESLISGPALAQRIKNDINKGTKTKLKKLIKKTNTPKEIVNKWEQAIESKDNYALGLRNFVGEKLSKIIAIAINCYDPSVIILGGYVTRKCSSFLVKKIKEKINTETCDASRRKITILVATEDETKSLIINTGRIAFWELQKR